MKSLKKNYKWEVETASAKHTIELHLGANTRDNIDIILDGNKIDRIKYQGLSLIPNIEYDIKCDDEIIKVVLYGSTVDIVHNGKYVTSGVEYGQKNKLPFIYTILVTVLSLASISMIFLYRSFLGEVSGNMAYIIAIAASCAFSLLSYSNSTAPFYPKKKKLMLSLFMVVAAWVVVFLVMAVLGDSGFWFSKD